MPANVEPVYTLTPQNGQGSLGAANTGADLSSNAALVFTGGTNGSLLVEVRIKYLPGTSTVATVARLWLNNNGTLSTTTNNSLISEITMAAITTTQVAATIDTVFQLPRNGLFLKASNRIYVTVGTWSTGTFMISAYGGDY